MSSDALPQVRIETFGADSIELVKVLDDRGLTSLVEDAVATIPASSDLASLRAVVLLFGEGRVGEARERIRKLAGPVLDAGVSLIAVVPAADTRRFEQFENDRSLCLPQSYDNVRNKPVPAVWPRFLVETGARDVANVIASRLPPAIHATSFQTNLDTDIDLLFGRAFADLVRIRVEPLDKDKQGKTSKVFRVDGEDARGQLLPFLVKVANRNNAAFELDNYRRHVEDFVPFPVRPSLVPERCVFGTRKGLLVQRFLEHENALGDVVLDTASPTTLHNVFDQLLAGWWHHGTAAQLVQGDRVLTSLRHWFDCTKTPKREAALRKHASYGKAVAPELLISRIDALAPRAYKRGWIHGDLHADNIRVRGTDAFLIDFGSVDQGPLLADPAALEASLVLKAGVACFAQDKRTLWADHVTQRLYQGPWHERVPARRDLVSDVPVLARLGDALRTIRMHALSIQTSEGEYAQLVAAAFLRQASYSSDASEQHRTECVSTLYSVADQVVTGLT